VRTANDFELGILNCDCIVYLKFKAILASDLHMHFWKRQQAEHGYLRRQAGKTLLNRFICGSVEE
jgi:hypothetical protein